MKAAVLEAFGEPLAIRAVPDPAPPPGGAVVRVEACGICRSDWHLWRGDLSGVTLPRIMGHEFAGVVEALDKSVTGFSVGDRVVVPFSLGDGTCELCRSGHSNICDNRISPGITADGAYARYVAVPYANHGLIRLPENISFKDAASLGCRFMTAFHGLVDQGELRPGEWVAIFGSGGIGLSATNIAAGIGALPIAVDIAAPKLDLARELGAVAVVDASKDDPVDAIREITRGGAHVAVDALGSAATARQALLSLRKRGRMLQIGLPVAEEPAVPVPMLTLARQELRIIGSLGMQTHRYPELLRLVELGRLHPHKLVTGEVRLEDVSDVLREMNDYRGVGVRVITPADA